MSDSLFVLTNQYLELAHKLADGDFDAATISDTIEASGIVDSIQIKAQGIEMVARGAESHNLAIDAEIARLPSLKAHRARTAQALREYIKSSMERLQIERIDCPLFQISVKKNPPAVEIYDPLSIPAEFFAPPEPKPPVPSKKAIAGA